MNCFTKETKYSLHKLISKSSIRSIWRIGRKSEKHDMYASDWRGCIGVASMQLCLRFRVLLSGIVHANLVRKQASMGIHIADVCISVLRNGVSAVLY
uniref:Uncharacterized protein n=1 Tax=Anopheles atroparvus TaxID=41427 RepID=A0AAG5CZB8_ANOAO